MCVAIGILVAYVLSFGIYMKLTEQSVGSIYDKGAFYFYYPILKVWESEYGAPIVRNYLKYLDIMDFSILVDEVRI